MGLISLSFDLFVPHRINMGTWVEKKGNIILWLWLKSWLVQMKWKLQYYMRCKVLGRVLPCSRIAKE